MAQQLVQLRSKKQPQLPESIPAPPQDVPSSLWIYRMKMKIFMLTASRLFQDRHALARVRRFAMSMLAPQSYRLRHRQALQGECNRCANCCRLIFKCPFLHENTDGTGHCTIYMTKHAPKVCVIFPLDPWDLAEIKRAIAPNTCSFSFAEEVKPIHKLPRRIPTGLRKLLRFANNRS